jgi:predicted ester cyclase
MSEAYKELVRRHFEEIFNQQNLAACDELIAEDFIEHGIAPFATEAPGRVNGPQAMRGTVKWLLTQFPDLRFTIEAIVVEGDVVAVRVFGEGTNLGSIGAMPPTGKRFGSRSSHWYRIQDGKLAEHWATRDDLLAFMQLGIIRTPDPHPG